MNYTHKIKFIQEEILEVYNNLIPFYEKSAFIYNNHNNLRSHPIFQKVKKCCDQANCLMDSWNLLDGRYFSVRKKKRYLKSVSVLNGFYALYDELPLLIRDMEHLVNKTTNQFNSSVEINMNQQGFLGNCNSKKELQQKYRSLAKKYHPDSRNGNAELFLKLQQEYEEKLETLNI